MIPTIWWSDILKLLGEIWNRVLLTRFERWCSSVKDLDAGLKYTPYCARLVDEGRYYAGGRTVRMSDLESAKVVNPEGFVYEVKINWDRRT